MYKLGIYSILILKADVKVYNVFYHGIIYIVMFFIRITFVYIVHIFMHNYMLYVCSYD